MVSCYVAHNASFLRLCGRGVTVVVAVSYATYSSVAFISGHDCGEQNSVMAP